MTIGAVASGKTTLATGAVRFDAVGDKYSRSASGLGGTHTMCCWAKIVVDRNAITCFIGQDDASTNYYYLSTTADGTSLRRDGTSGAAFPSGLNMTVGTWVYMATVNDTSAGGDATCILRRGVRFGEVIDDAVAVGQLGDTVGGGIEA